MLLLQCCYNGHNNWTNSPQEHKCGSLLRLPAASVCTTEPLWAPASLEVAFSVTSTVDGLTPVCYRAAAPLTARSFLRDKNQADGRRRWLLTFHIHFSTSATHCCTLSQCHNLLTYIFTPPPPQPSVDQLWQWSSVQAWGDQYKCTGLIF